MMLSSPLTSVGHDLFELRRLIEQKVDRHEIHTLTGALDRLEDALREACANIDRLGHRCAALEEGAFKGR